jgi:hypothetical protein
LKVAAYKSCDTEGNYNAINSFHFLNTSFKDEKSRIDLLKVKQSTVDEKPIETKK